MNREIPEFVVVEGAGGENEWIVCSRVSPKDASDWMDSNYSASQQDIVGVDVMKRNTDGTLTTEF